MKKSFLLLITLCFVVIMQAQVSKTIKLTTPGSLTTTLTETEKNTITNLTLTGTIDARDFKTMRDSLLFLAVLDLSGASITAYIGTDGTGWGRESYTENTIPESAFENGSNFISIILPSSVTLIEEYAFEDCSGLKSINLPSSLVTIEDESFPGCTSLTSITIPSSVTQLGAEIFSGCDSLATVIISEGVTTIGRWMFDYCGKLKNLSLPSSLITIEEGAFEDCISLTSVAVPSSVISIGSGAFSGCTGLTSVILPTSLKEISDSRYFGAFEGCTALTSIKIPSSTSIGRRAFFGCTGLTTVDLSMGVVSIGSEAFSGVSSLKSIYIYCINPSKIDGDVFYETDKNNCILYVPFGTKKDYQVTAKWKEFKNILEMSGFYLSSTTVNLSPVSDRKDSITISSNIAWTASSDQKWLTINPASGTGIGKLTFTATENTVNLSRIAIVTVSATGVPSQTITITQAPVTGVATLEVSSTSVSIANEANSLASVNVKSNAIWSASSNQTWLTINTATGTGNGQLTFAATENPNTATRTAIVTVSATGVASQTIIVTQEIGKATISVSSGTLSFKKEAGSNTNEYIISNTTWFATSDQPWLTIDPATGTGNWILTFYAAENTTNISRSATVTFSATGAVSQVVTVTQAPGTGTGITPITNDEVNLYPNPVIDGFRIQGITGKHFVTLYDLNGKICLSKELLSDEYIPLASLMQGVYLLRISSKDGIIEKRLIKK
jgi:hypothetical protein